jgi:hypothetical protein
MGFILALIILDLVRKGKVKGLSAGKDGIKLALVEKRDTTRYNRDRRITSIDDNLKAKGFEITYALEEDFVTLLSGNKTCSPVLFALVGQLIKPMVIAAQENSFKEKLSLLNREGYIGRKLSELQRKYEYLIVRTANEPCAYGPGENIHYPAWNEIEQKLLEILKRWAGEIAGEVRRACRAKIEIYREHLGQYESDGDESGAKLMNSLIEKNDNYIRDLGQ